MPQIIAITGGIGSGKSVISRILRSMGYPVYDSDTEAKALMDADDTIKERLRSEISPETVRDNRIDRKALASIVFADAGLLSTLNRIVHSAVRQHLSRWQQSQSAPVVFVETAILFESGLNRMVDAECRVTAPVDLRVDRVMKRNGISRESVLARIESQQYTPAADEPRPPLSIITNDGIAAVLPQVETLLQHI